MTLRTFPQAAVSGGAIVRYFPRSEPFTGPDGVQHPGNWGDVWSDQDWVAKCPGWSLLPVEGASGHNEAKETATLRPMGEWTVGETAVTRTYAVASIPLADRRSAMKAAAATVRYAKETGGVTVGGAVVRTDRESQAMVNGAYSAAQYGVIPEFDFKAATGWVTLSAAQIIAIGSAVALHVQACFSRERALCAAIDAAEGHDALDLIDLEADWPA